jgi:Putative beta-barrel porin-2, OmpL-like. bbp2
MRFNRCVRGCAVPRNSPPAYCFAWISLVSALLVFAPPVARAQTAIAQDPGSSAGAAQPQTTNGFFGKIQVVAVGDGYYVYNENRTADVELRNFDTRDRLALSMLKVGVLRTPDADERFGFRVDVQAGPAATIVHAAEPATSGVLRHLEQAYVSYLAPFGKGLQIDFGEFVTPAGAEVIEAKDNWNYSRSLLFALAIPYYHMGLRATYAVNDRVSFAGMTVNGWNNIADNNGGKTYGAQATVKATTKVTVVQNYIAGPEQPQNTRDWRQLSDTVLTYAMTPALSLMVNYDYGRDTIGQVPVHWQGVAAYGRYQVTARFAVSPRVEWYDDANGVTTGVAQALREVTTTGEAKLGHGLLCRIEYRHDISGVASFEQSAGQRVQGQTTVGVGVMYAFAK